MQELGCHAVDGTAFGEKEGLPFSAQWRESGMETELLFHFAAAADTRALVARLKKEKQPHLRWFAENGEEGHALVALYRPPSDFYAKSGIYNLLHQVAALQAEGALAPPENCPLCGLAGCDACACLAEVYRPVHAACVNTRLTLPEKDEKVPETGGGHILTGILGALLGAFIAALPIWTFALNDGTVHWVLYAFIPLLSGLCYRMMRGRASSGWAGISVLLASLLAAMVLELIWFWVLLSNEYGQTIPFFITVQRYFASHSLGSTLRDMLSCLLALFAGYLATTVFLRRYVQDGVVPRHTVRGAAYVRSTLRPRGQSGPDAKPADEPTQPETPQGEIHGTESPDAPQ